MWWAKLREIYSMLQVRTHNHQQVSDRERGWGGNLNMVYSQVYCKRFGSESEDFWRLKPPVVCIYSIYNIADDLNPLKTQIHPQSVRVVVVGGWWFHAIHLSFICLYTHLKLARGLKGCISRDSPTSPRFSGVCRSGSLGYGMENCENRICEIGNSVQNSRSWRSK